MSGQDPSLAQETVWESEADKKNFKFADTCMATLGKIRNLSIVRPTRLRGKCFWCTGC